MGRVAAILYSVISYAIGVAALVYLILFTAGLFVPVTINIASPFAPNLTGPTAILWNVLLVALWGAQHTIMASLEFKRWQRKFLPAAIERSTYLIGVAIMTAGLVLLWAPLPHVFWDISATPFGMALLGVYFFGWVIVLISTFLINHFHLFGLQQAWMMRKAAESKTETFRTPLFYKLVRHPMMTGVLISLWSVPEMTAGRLVFNLAMTAYVFVGLHFEERTLVHDLGEDYETYRQTTPSVIPGLPVKAKQSAAVPSSPGARG